MPMVSLKNHNQNSPWAWKRFESACFLGLIPTATGFVTAIPLQDEHKVWALAGISLFGGLVKMVGISLKDTPDDPTPTDKTT